MRWETGDGRREFSHKKHKRHKRHKKRERGTTGDSQFKGEWSAVTAPINSKNRPPCHLYQLIHYRARFAVPPSFREAIAKRAIAKPHQRKPSRTACKSVSQRPSLLQPTLQADSCRAITKALCAVPSPSAFESGIFCLLFVAVDKK